MACATKRCGNKSRNNSVTLAQAIAKAEEQAKGLSTVAKPKPRPKPRSNRYM